MKSFILGLIIVCVVAGTIIYSHRQITPPTPASIVASSPQQMIGQAPLEKITAPKQEQARIVPENTDNSKPTPVTTTVLDQAKSEESIKSALRRAIIDQLISPQTSFLEKKILAKQLLDAGELDSAIAELKQREASNPNDAEIPTTLGQLDLGKLQTVQDYNQKGILALEADQYFNTALSVDPANWDAKFSKAAALSGWPAEMNKGPEVIQQLSSLIDQQERMTPQPQFAQTYVLLGDQYQKAGQLDYAQATWQLGLTKFPGDPTLQKRINTPSSQ